MKRVKAKTKKIGLIKIIHSHIKGVNKYMTDEFLNQLSPKSLLAFAHPLERDRFKKKLEDKGLI